MKVAFRADASLTIGMGHIVRCLALADALRKRGANCIFLSRNHSGHLHQLVKACGYPLISFGESGRAFRQTAESNYESWLGVDFQKDAKDTRAKVRKLSLDWLVVDHYGLDARWEDSLRPYCERILAIDDLANRNHNVDVLLDQNLGKTAADYKGKVPTSCTLMMGPRYALLRPEFAKLRAQSLSNRNQSRLKKILVTMGGVDLGDATSRVLEGLRSWVPSTEFEVTVVLGPTAPWRDQVRERAQHLPFPTKLFVNASHMAKLMCNSDIAIGAAGSASWERCCLGLPTLQLVLAENQRPIAEALREAGAALQLESDTLSESLHRTMSQLNQDPELLIRMSRSAGQVTDGEGAERVARFITEGADDNAEEGLNV